MPPIRCSQRGISTIAAGRQRAKRSRQLTAASWQPPTRGAQLGHRQFSRGPARRRRARRRAKGASAERASACCCQHTGSGAQSRASHRSRPGRPEARAPPQNRSWPVWRSRPRRMPMHLPDQPLGFGESPVLTEQTIGIRFHDVSKLAVESWGSAGIPGNPKDLGSETFAVFSAR